MNYGNRADIAIMDYYREEIQELKNKIKELEDNLSLAQQELSEKDFSIEKYKYELENINK